MYGPQTFALDIFFNGEAYLTVLVSVCHHLLLVPGCSSPFLLQGGDIPCDPSRVNTISIFLGYEPGWGFYRLYAKFSLCYLFLN